MTSWKRATLNQPKKKKEIKKCFHCGAQAPPRMVLPCTRCQLWDPSTPPRNVKKQKTIKYLDKAYVISLNDHNKSRWNLFSRRTLPLLRSKGYQVKRFTGIDGSKLDQVNKALELLLPEKRKLYRQACLWKQQNHPGSTGCYLSHMTLWKHLHFQRKQIGEYALILEDDATFVTHGIDNMAIILEKAKKHPWDILYLGHSIYLKGKKCDPLLVRPLEKQDPRLRTNCGFWGYVIRLEAVPKLLEAVESFQELSIDETIVRSFGDTIEALFCLPSLVKQSSVYSVRVAMDKLAKKSNLNMVPKKIT